MSDFGVAGKVTVRKDTLSIVIKLTKGEFLTYKVTPKGAEALFVFSCASRSLLASTDFDDHPADTYEWKWSKDDFGSDEHDDVYGVRFQFITAVKYTLVVKHHKQDGSVVTLKDIDYESQNPGDWYQDILNTLSS